MLVSDQFDRIEQTFTLVPGRTVAPGAYHWREGTVKYTMAPASRCLGTANATVGDFYSGSRRSVGGGVTWRASPSLGIETTFQRNAISLASGDFVANLAGLARAVRLVNDGAWQRVRAVQHPDPGRSAPTHA